MSELPTPDELKATLARLEFLPMNDPHRAAAIERVKQLQAYLEKEDDDR